MPSCAQVRISKNSSSVPQPPGSAMKPSDEFGHHRLPLVHRRDDTKIGETAVRDFLLGERPRDDASHVATAPRATASATAPMSPMRAPPYTRPMPRGELAAQPVGRRSILRSHRRSIRQTHTLASSLRWTASAPCWLGRLTRGSDATNRPPFGGFLRLRRASLARLRPRRPRVTRLINPELASAGQ